MADANSVFDAFDKFGRIINNISPFLRDEARELISQRINYLLVTSGKYAPGNLRDRAESLIEEISRDWRFFDGWASAAQAEARAEFVKLIVEAAARA